MRRTLAIALAAVVVALGCSSCLTTPGDTSKIEYVSTTTVSGWTYDYYRNRAYPCSISGYQTFVIGRKTGSSATATAPLWMWQHGGGTGYFDPTGKPIPDTNQMTEQSATSLRGGISNNGISAKLRADPAGFRLLAVSYCNRDLYSGTGQADPNNPNPNDDGSAKTTNGLLASKAALAFTKQTYPTSRYVVAGGSAGSIGSYSVGWALQESGDAPAGIVGDASVVNQEAGRAAHEQGACTNGQYEPGGVAILGQRVDPQIADPANSVDRLVSSGRLTVPVLHIWNHGDKNTCGSVPVQCPLRDGTVVTMGNTDCLHAPLAAAIDAQGPTSRSMNLPVCVDTDATPDCSVHVVTPKAGLTNTDPASPADYNTAVLGWIHARLADA